MGLGVAEIKQAISFHTPSNELIGTIQSGSAQASTTPDVQLFKKIDQLTHVDRFVLLNSQRIIIPSLEERKYKQNCTLPIKKSREPNGVHAGMGSRSCGTKHFL